MRRHLGIIIITILTALTISNCSSAPTGPDENSAGPGLFVLNGLAQTVSAIHFDSAAVSQNILTTGSVPSDIELNGNHLLVLNSTPPSLSVHTVRSGSTVTIVNFPPGSNPFDVKVDGENLYVTGLMSNRLYLLDAVTYTIEDSLEMGTGPEGITTDDNNIYVANTGGWPDYESSAVTVIEKEAFEVTATIPTSTNPQRLALAPDGNLHVVCTGNYNDIPGRVDVINVSSSTVDTTLQIGGTPGYIAIRESGRAYLSDTGDGDSGFLYSYNTVSFEIFHDRNNPIKVNPGAMDLLLYSARDALFITNFNANTVQEWGMEKGEIRQTWEVSDGPQALALRR